MRACRLCGSARAPVTGCLAGSRACLAGGRGRARMSIRPFKQGARANPNARTDAWKVLDDAIGKIFAQEAFLLSYEALTPPLPLTPLPSLPPGALLAAALGCAAAQRQ